MNPLKRIYCNQYYELKAKGKAHMAMSMGTKLAGIALVFVTLGLFYFLLGAWPGFNDGFDDLSKDLFGRRSGRLVGKFVAGLFFLVCYFLVRFTLGRKSSYERTIAEFDALDQATREGISKSGLIIFVASVVIFGVGIVTGLVGS